LARPLLEDGDVISQFQHAVAESGFVGDPRPAVHGYISLTSRLLNRPLNAAYIAQSSSGKNAAVDAVLPFFPEDAYYLVGAASPRALIFNDADFQHRIVVFQEADSIPEDGPAASALRSIMSDFKMLYEIVEKGKDGVHHTRRIEKPGPTGLITTSVRSLGPQASTRALEVSISDSPELTRQIMHAKAAARNRVRPSPDYTPWVALQKWLALAGERRVSIPFGHALADIIPPSAVRMRRDFDRLLSVIEAIALLRQFQRERDQQERIVATLEDYQTARWLLEDIFSASVNDGLTPAVRETVQTVEELLKISGPTVSESQLVKQLGLAKSTIHYRVRRAIHGGWLVNASTQRGAPAQLMLGTPLPDDNPLPSVEILEKYVKEAEKHSNIRTPLANPDTEEDSNGGSNPAEQLEPSQAAAFEVFKDRSNGHSNTSSKAGPDRNGGVVFECSNQNPAVVIPHKSVGVATAKEDTSPVFTPVDEPCSCPEPLQRSIVGDARQVCRQCQFSIWCPFCGKCRWCRPPVESVRDPNDCVNCGLYVPTFAVYKYLLDGGLVCWACAIEEEVGPRS
jgi:hypothetical protein